MQSICNILGRNRDNSPRHIGICHLYDICWHVTYRLTCAYISYVKNVFWHLYVYRHIYDNIYVTEVYEANKFSQSQ